MSDLRLSFRCATTALQGAVLAGSLFLGVLGAGAEPALAAATPMVNLGEASTYAVLSGASVGNTVSAAGAPHTALRGDRSAQPGSPLTASGARAHSSSSWSWSTWAVLRPETNLSRHPHRPLA
jgi:hypothetical protein